jgi:hypothetical protein
MILQHYILKIKLDTLSISFFIIKESSIKKYYMYQKQVV